MASKLVLLLAVIATLVIGVLFYNLQPEVPPVLYGTALIGDRNNSPTELEFMVQGSKIYVDQNDDGQPQAAEELPDRKMPAVTNPETNMTFTVSKIDLGVAPESVSETLTQKLILYVDIGDKSPYQMTGKMVLTPEKENWLNFGGSMTFLEMEKLALKKSSQPEEIKLFVGTVASGLVDAHDDSLPDPNETFRTTIVIPTEKPPFPIGSIKFFVPDSEPVVKEFVMDHFC